MNPAFHYVLTVQMLGYAYIAEFYGTTVTADCGPSDEESLPQQYVGFLTQNLEGDTHALQAFLGE